MSALCLLAPAKINLSLRIHRRRADGFHELSTRMVPLELADEVRMEVLPGAARGEVRMTCSDESLPCGEGNLAVMAVRALEKVVGLLPGLGLHVEKRIPHGAGLGGGSSDAAAVLRGVRELCGCAVDEAALSGLAAGIGSDVPFFLDGGVCDATGRGELLAPVVGEFPRLRVLLVKLAFGVPTPWAYQQWRTAAKIGGLVYKPQMLDWGTLVNDLERPVFTKYPVLGHLKGRLMALSGVAGALMSGSGSTVFAVMEVGADAAVEAAVEAAVRDEVGEEVWLCWTHTVSRTVGAGAAG